MCRLQITCGSLYANVNHWVCQLDHICTPPGLSPWGASHWIPLLTGPSRAWAGHGDPSFISPYSLPRKYPPNILYQPRQELFTLRSATIGQAKHCPLFLLSLSLMLQCRNTHSKLPQNHQCNSHNELTNLTIIIRWSVPTSQDVLVLFLEFLLSWWWVN